jgi:predicted metal-dependent peptidase
VQTSGEVSVNNSGEDGEITGVQSDELGNAACMVDGSGSCWEPGILQRFAILLQGVLETFDCALTIIYHDIPVHAVETWKSTDGPLTLRPRGGGGTSHVPAFRLVGENHLDPACIVALTDCFTEFPAASDYPTLWCCVGNKSARVPFGSLVQVE